MAERRPLVLTEDGFRQLPAGDTLPMALPTLSATRFDFWCEGDKSQTLSGKGTLSVPWTQPTTGTNPSLFSFFSHGRPVRAHSHLYAKILNANALALRLYNAATSGVVSLSSYSYPPANTFEWYTMIATLPASFFTPGAGQYRLGFNMYQADDVTSSNVVTLAGYKWSFIYLEELYSQ
jgi:hypothetical protein